MTRPRMSSNWRGIVVVVVLLAVGLGATWVARVYWTGVAERTWPKEAPAAPAQPVDPARLAAQLEAIQQTYVNDRSAQTLTAAEDATRALLAVHPDHGPALVFLGQLMIDASRFEEALGFLQKAAALDPEQPELQLLTGNVALMLKRPDVAEPYLRKAVELDPQTARYRLFLAQLAIERGDTDGARRRYLEALQLDSSLHEAYVGLADLSAGEGQFQAALTQIQKAIECTTLAQRDKQVLYIRKKASFLRRANQPREALMVLQGLLPSEQRQPIVLEEMATCWALLGEPARGAEVYEQALKDSPTDWRLLGLAANWRLKAGDVEAARKHIEALRVINASLPTIKDLERRVERYVQTGSKEGL